MPLKYHHLLKFVSIRLGWSIFLIAFAGTTFADDPLLQRGQKLFKKCVHCHSYKKQQGHRIGPNLYGLFGRKAGAIDDYDYSEAWKNAKFLWTDKTLDTYLISPHKMIPNNRMPFDGLSRSDDRRALIIYMRKIVSP